MKYKQLYANYSVHQHTQGIPARQMLSNITRETSSLLSPVDDVQQYERHPNESHEDQK